jgi:hypothetical protein
LSVLQQTERLPAQLELAVQTVGSGQLPPAVHDALRARGILVGPDVPHKPAGRIAFAAAGGPAPEAAAAQLPGRRILVLHSDPEHASLVTWALAARGADVRIFEASPDALDAAATFDADVVLVDEHDLFAGSWERVCALWQHAVLRWTPCLLSPANLLRDGGPAQLDDLCRAVHELAAPRDGCTEQAARARAFELPIESLGPLRTLRALLRSRADLQLEFVTSRLTVDVDVTEERILGASVRVLDGAASAIEGLDALALLLDEAAGTVRVEPLCRDPLANIMTDVDSVLRELSAPEAPIAAAGSGVRPLGGPADELDEDTRIQSEGSVIALLRRERARLGAPDERAAQPAPSLRVEEPAEEPTTAAGERFHDARFIASIVVVCAAAWLVALGGAALWRQLAARSEAPPRSASTAPHLARPLAAAVQPPASRTPEPLLEAAQPAADAEPLPATALATSSGERDPEVARLVKRGNELRRKKRLSRARAAYEGALDLAPDETSALAGLVRTAIAQDDLATAMISALRLVELAPQTTAYRLLLRRVEKLNARRSAESLQRAD